MSKKSKVFLAMAAIAISISLLLKFAFTPPATDISDFAIGLGAALMLGVVLTWKDKAAPRT